MKVGDKVVCVAKVYPQVVYQGEILPVVNEIYTIRNIETYMGMTGLHLDEIVNTPRLYVGGMYECMFNTKAFRPINYSFGEDTVKEIEKELSLIPQTVEI